MSMATVAWSPAALGREGGGVHGPLQARSQKPARAPGAGGVPTIDAASAPEPDLGRAEFLRQLEHRLEDQRRQLEETHAADRPRWANDEAHRLGESLQTSLCAIKATMTSLTSRVLAPIIEARLRATAVSDLEAVLDGILAPQDGLTLEVSGPEDLVEALLRRLSARGISLAVLPGETCERRVKAGHPLLETRIGDWVARVKEALG